MPHIDWTVLHFPAQALEETPDALGRAPGEFLWPEKYGPEAYDLRKRTLGTRGWTTLYQGMPAPEEGETFKRDWWQYYDPDYLPRLRRVVITVDSSFKDGVTTDYSVFAIWGEDYAGNYYVIDLWRARVEFPQLIATGHNIFLKTMHRFAAMPGYGSGFVTPMYVEDRASGQSAIQVWRREWHDAAGRRRPGLPVLPFKVKNVSKIARAEGVSPLVEAGRCFLPSDAEWLQTFIDEHASFPAGKHDDQVDTTSMALSVLSERGVVTIKGY